MKPTSGDTVRVHYTGTLTDGSEFDSSRGRDPIEFTLGEGNVIPGFEAAVADLDVDGTVTVTIPAAEAYGERDERAVQKAPPDFFGGSDAPAPGMMVQLVAPDGQQHVATIVAVEDDGVVLDFNHPLAGKDLTFELTLVEIVGS